MIEFFIPMKSPPTITAQQHKVANGNFYDPQELKTVKVRLKTCLAPFVPKQPLDGALRLVVKWCYPIPKTGKHYNGEYKYTKPDTDNLNKALKDIMEDLGFFVNDSRIASEIIEKFWADVPGIYVRLEEL